MQQITKLTPAADFVLHFRSMTTSELCETYPKIFKTPVWTGSQSEMVKDMLAIDAIKWRLVGEYAKFLKRPLELFMFVPIDEEGEIVTEPKEADFTDNTGFVNNAFFIEMNDYQAAKARCLFEGFEFREGAIFTPNSDQPFGVNRFYHLWVKGVTAEQLIDDIFPLTLTPTAKKEIYGS